MGHYFPLYPLFHTSWNDFQVPTYQDILSSAHPHSTTIKNAQETPDNYHSDSNKIRRGNAFHNCILLCGLTVNYRDKSGIMLVSRLNDDCWTAIICIELNRMHQIWLVHLETTLQQHRSEIKCFDGRWSNWTTSWYFRFKNSSFFLQHAVPSECFFRVLSQWTASNYSSKYCGFSEHFKTHLQINL